MRRNADSTPQKHPAANVALCVMPFSLADRSSVTAWGLSLGDRPGFAAGVEQLAEIALAALLLRGRDLAGHQLVVDRALHVAEDAEGHLAVRPLGDARKGERVGRVGRMLVVRDA